MGARCPPGPVIIRWRRIVDRRRRVVDNPRRGDVHGRRDVNRRGRRHVARPAFEKLGARLDLDLRAWGWYPAGGGEMTVTIQPTDDGLTAVVSKLIRFVLFVELPWVALIPCGS